MRPGEVLDHQAALLDHLESKAYAKYMEGYMHDLVRKSSSPRSGDVDSGAEVVHGIRNSLKVAYAYHVQPEMMPVVRMASADLEGTDYLTHDNLPTDAGFMIFDEPWFSKDVWGETLGIAAIQWFHGSGAPTNLSGARGVPGVWVVSYSDIRDERDEVSAKILEMDPEFRNMMGRYHINHFWFIPYGRRVGPMDDPTPAEYARFAQDGQALMETVPNNDRFVVAVFRLLNQVIVETRDADLDRATKRRAKRANLPQRVQTIALRRKEVRYFGDQDREHGEVEWQHQWWVRGHWAWRKCGPEHPLAEEYEKGFHARLYIAPYPKGPEDAPILITEKVFDLSR